MRKLLARFNTDEKGATAIEYGLIAALISITIITAATQIGGNIQERFESVSEQLGAAVE